MSWTPEQRRSHRKKVNRELERFRVHPLPLKPTDPWEVVTAKGYVGRWVWVRFS